MRVDLFDFALPEELIAQRPVSPRDSARLLDVAVDGLHDGPLRAAPKGRSGPRVGSHVIAVAPGDGAVSGVKIVSHGMRAYIWGGLLIIASQPLRLVLSGTPAWLALAGMLAR